MKDKNKQVRRKENAQSGLGKKQKRRKGTETTWQCLEKAQKSNNKKGDARMAHTQYPKSPQQIQANNDRVLVVDSERRWERSR